MSTKQLSPLAGPATTSGVDGEQAHLLATSLGRRLQPCMTVGELIDCYMAEYAGRDPARIYRLESWKARLGDMPLAELTDDHVFHAIETIASEPARIFVGRDADGKPIHRAKGKRAVGTVNRYQNALAAVFSWGIRKRRVAKSFENPCRKVERLPENPGVVRFLSDDERTRLLEACKASKWPALYTLVLLAVTTGARRGELLSLRWRDVDLERAQAYVASSKNGEPKVLPLVAAVIEDLRRLHATDLERFKIGTPEQLIFHSSVRPNIPYHFQFVWDEALRGARVTKFRFHDLRHTCASYLAQQGATLLEIADVLGHRQLQMTKRYSHLTTQSKAALVNRLLGDIR